MAPRRFPSPSEQVPLPVVCNAWTRWSGRPAGWLAMVQFMSHKRIVTTRSKCHTEFVLTFIKLVSNQPAVCNRSQPMHAHIDTWLLATMASHIHTADQRLYGIQNCDVRVMFIHIKHIDTHFKFQYIYLLIYSSCFLFYATLYLVSHGGSSYR